MKMMKKMEMKIVFLRIGIFVGRERERERETDRSKWAGSGEKKRGLF